jgi:prepilin-type N-terminal cleavage/methylation domain-containing protein
MKAVSLISVRRRRAFTIPELLVALTIFSFVTIGIIFAHLYGLTMLRITETSLTATASARKVAAKLTEEIRTCDDMEIGDVKLDNGTNQFVGLLNGETQQGSAIAIYPTENHSKYILYFVNLTPADQTLWRMTEQPGSAVILAESITNTVAFRAENPITGQVLTNALNNRVIHFNLEFYQPRRHKQVADYYKLESSVTRRAD